MTDYITGLLLSMAFGISFMLSLMHCFKAKMRSHGSWIKVCPGDKNDGNFRCSNCLDGIDIATGEETPIERGLLFCPNCGAKMYEEDKE